MMKRNDAFIFKRKFYPVGQGAFFSEHLFLESGRSLLNIVYDCGTKSGNPKNIFEEKADNMFNSLNCNHIDVLFISHLDEDHVNKIKYLITKNFVDEKTTIIMPLYDAEDVICISLAIKKDLTKIFSVLKKINSKILYVRPIAIESLSSSEGRTIDISDIPFGVNDISVFELPGKIIPSSSVLTYKRIWNYRTASLLESAQKEFMIKIKESDIVEEGDLEKIFILFKNRKIKGSEEERKYKEIKDIYSKVGIRLGTANINVNSLLLLSYPTGEIDELCFAYKYNSLGVLNYKYRYYDFYFPHPICVGSCLYTGDTFMGVSNNIDYLKIIIEWTRSYCNGLELLQVPHHGSRNNYSKSLVHDLRYAFAFTNFDSRKNIYDPFLGLRFVAACRPFLYITEEKDSYFEQTLFYNGFFFERGRFCYSFLQTL